MSQTSRSPAESGAWQQFSTHVQDAASTANPATTQADPRSVTPKPKCYVFLCLGCGLLKTSERSDKLTCSAACRVRVHRNGRLQVVRAFARAQHFPPALMPQCQALKILRPDLAAEVLAGRLEVKDVRDDIYRAFIERVDTGAAP